MSARTRLRLFALVCAATIAVGCESALAAFAVDTSRLPRITGSREVYSSPTSTSFITRESVARAFELTASALINDDWQPYDDPSTPRTSDASIRMSFKKEGRALSLFIATAPAQANATSVSYTEVALRNDLPFPKGATRIKFDPERPYLSFVTAQDAEATVDYFRNELRRLGWSQWLVRDDTASLHRGLSVDMPVACTYAYFVRENSRPLMLTFTRRDDNGFNVEIMAIAARQLPVGHRQAPAADAAAHVQSAQPIPVPHASEEIDFDNERGTLTFSNPASAGIVAEYYRSALTPHGWQEVAAIEDDKMVVLRFSNGAKDLSVTIIQTGSRTRVTADGSGLKI
jgi:hypothetical protein